MIIARSSFIILIILIGFCACDREHEAAPSYIYIDKFSFQVKQGQGSAHQNITDGWLYVNGNYYGAYELPAWIPVLEEGSSEVILFPGYRQNGSITNSFRYALLNSYTAMIDLVSRETDTIRPVTSYQDGLKFLILESFDGNHLLAGDRDQDPDTKILLSASAEAFEGTNSGLIELTSAHPYLFAEYINPVNITPSGDPIILELSYLSDIPFSIGFTGRNVLGEEIDLVDGVVFPKKTWTKIYFDFRDNINKSGSVSFKLAVTAAYRSDSIPAIQRIFLDNIKLIQR